MQERNQAHVQEPPQRENPFEVRANPEIAEAVNFRGVPEQNYKIHFGIPETKSPLSEKTIRDIKLTEGEASIYLTPKTDGQ